MNTFTRQAVFVAGGGVTRKRVIETTRRIAGIFAVMVLSLLAGCAAVPRASPITADQCWSDPEQRDERMRLYTGVSDKEILHAAQRLLRLAGQDDMHITSAPNGINAEFQRNRSIYLFLVAHTASVSEQWVIAVTAQSDGTSACVHMRGQFFSDTFVLGAEPITHAIYPASAVEREPGKGFRPHARAYAVDFSTFWSRLDFLLGRSASGHTWPTCPADASNGIRSNKARARDEMNPLCHALIDETAPTDTPHAR